MAAKTGRAALNEAMLALDIAAECLMCRNSFKAYRDGGKPDRCLLSMALGTLVLCLAAASIRGGKTEVGACAFYGCPGLTIHAPAGSRAERYAKVARIPFEAS